ncbi:MAG TPA: flagellar hook-basal body complex protein FliE [Terracidiphilus sp.]|nr:flagellar hook-basal body complex protein FliE [Terracidiphilus sp.]
MQFSLTTAAPAGPAATAPAANGPAAGSGPAETGAPAPFSDLLSDAVGQVNALEDQARNAIEGLMTGSGVDVHTAMIAAQKADMAFEMALAVRNKAVQAYQQVMGMQF